MKRALLLVLLASCDGVVSRVTGEPPEDCCALWPDTEAISECIAFYIETPRTCVVMECFPNPVTACSDEE